MRNWRGKVLLVVVSTALLSATQVENAFALDVSFTLTVE